MRMKLSPEERKARQNSCQRTRRQIKRANGICVLNGCTNNTNGFAYCRHCARSEATRRVNERKILTESKKIVTEAMFLLRLYPGDTLIQKIKYLTSRTNHND